MAFQYRPAASSNSASRTSRSWHSANAATKILASSSVSRILRSSTRWASARSRARDRRTGMPCCVVCVWLVGGGSGGGWTGLFIGALHFSFSLVVSLTYLPCPPQTPKTHARACAHACQPHHWTSLPTYLACLNVQRIDDLLVAVSLPAVVDRARHVAPL